MNALDDVVLVVKGSLLYLRSPISASILPFPNTTSLFLVRPLRNYQKLDFGLRNQMISGPSGSEVWISRLVEVV